MRKTPAAVLLALAPLAWAQNGARTVTFRSSADGSTQPYVLYVPHDLDPARKYPVVVSLHSEDTNHRIGLRQVFGLSIRSGETNPEDLQNFRLGREPGFIVVAPLARGAMDYRGIAETDVYDALADAERQLPIDPDRVYLTGVSMGGSAALRLALTRPDVWAAVAAVCPAAPEGVEEFARNAAALPVRIYHGELDPINPAAVSRAWQRRLVDAGVPVSYIEYPGVRHDAWVLAYRNAGVFTWFEPFRRNRFPGRVRLAADSYRNAASYWVRIDGLTPGVCATIEARREGREIAVDTAHLEGFTLTPESPAVAVVIDGERVRVPRGAALSFEKQRGAWRLGRFTPPGKRPGAEGPISEAVRGRQIYVYGSGGAVTAEELERRKQVAEKAAEWSTPRSRLTVEFAVKADTAVTPEDLAGSDVVLFGTRATNQLIERFAPELPLALNPSAADYGLVFVAPVGGRYALVCSGLPWWTGAAESKRGGPPLAPEQYRVLSTFGDFILFKGSLAHVVAEGRFDSNWKVPAGEAEKMLATGAVTIRK